MYASLVKINPLVNGQKPYFGHLSAPVTLKKKRVKIPKFINSSPSPSNLSMQIWEKSNSWLEDNARKCKVDTDATLVVGGGGHNSHSC